ncbi:g1379 [Coccomyxa elongata]
MATLDIHAGRNGKLAVFAGSDKQREAEVQDGHPKTLAKKLAAGVLSTVAAAALALAAPAQAETLPFLSSTGAKGPLVEEEARLFKLRQEIEGEARDELQRARLQLEDEARTSSSGKLCATPFGVDVVGITEVIALTGALVGGISARARKAELERLNEQLRKINMSLRQQARAGTVYAPGLNYAPLPLPPPSASKRSDDSPVAELTDTAIQLINGVKPSVAVQERQAEPVINLSGAMSTTGALSTSSVLASTDEEEMTPEAKQCVQALREGKRLLKEKQGASAMVRFERALMLAKALSDKCQERRATRGLAAAARLQGQHRAAIQHLLRVLEISKEMKDTVGDADAYGTIADIYTEMGNFDTAAQFYDKYIERMEYDGPV